MPWFFECRFWQHVLGQLLTCLHLLSVCRQELARVPTHTRTHVMQDNRTPTVRARTQHTCTHTYTRHAISHNLLRCGCLINQRPVNVSACVADPTRAFFVAIYRIDPVWVVHEVFARWRCTAPGTHIHPVKHCSSARV